MGAKAETTHEYFGKSQVAPSKQKIFDGLAVSALGAGTYLGLSDDAADAQYLKVLIEAASGGINFFDTSINYRGERSEKVLGKAIKELDARGFPRESFVIATKGGFIPNPGPPESFDEYLRVHFLDTEIISPEDIVAGSHCMSPSFLDNQIDVSRKNLQIECIDLYYLHNPEQQMAEVGEEIFYKRLEASFLLFEKKVAAGKIARYGIATWNGFRQKKGALQLSNVLQCAKRAGGEGHHFKAIQLPFNLVMLEALHIKNQSFGKEKKTVITAACEHNISIMASSPLMQSKVACLCSKVFESLPFEASRISQALQFVLSTPHICTAFAGMKELSHWEANRKMLYSAPWPLSDWTAACAALGIHIKTT